MYPSEVRLAGGPALRSPEFDTALTATGLTSRKHQVLATAVGAEHTQTQLARIVGLDKTTGKVVSEEPLLTDLHQRIRDVRVGPDGAIYVLTDTAGMVITDSAPSTSQLLRLTAGQ